MHNHRIYFLYVCLRNIVRGSSIPAIVTAAFLKDLHPVISRNSAGDLSNSQAAS